MLSRNFKLLVIMFSILWTILISYIYWDHSNYVYFWLITLLNVLVILIQINYSKITTEHKLIYLEILLLFISLQLLCIVNLGPGISLDQYFDVKNIYQIYNYNWDPGIVILGSSTESYPGAHITIVILSQLINQNMLLKLLDNQLFDLIKVMTILINSMIIILYMLIGKNLFKNEKIVLLSSLGFIFLFVFTNLGFSRQDLSTVLFFIILYLIFLGDNKKPEIIILLVLSVISLIFSHPLAPIILLVVLSLYFISIRIIEKNYYINFKILQINIPEMFKSFKSKYIVNLNLITFLFVLILAYFVYVSFWEQKQLINTVLILKGTLQSTPIGSGFETPLHWRIFLYSQALLGLISGILVIKSKKALNNFYCVFFFSLGLTLTALSFIFYHFNIEFIRFTLFSWPFILFSVSYSIVNYKYKQIMSIFIVFFIISNMFGYFPNIYDNTLQFPGEWEQSVNEQQKAAILSINPSGNVLANHYFSMILLFENVTYVGDPNLYSEYILNSSRKKRLDYLFISKEDFRLLFIRGMGKRSLNEEIYNSYQNTQKMLKIYDNGNSEGYKFI